LGEKIDPFPYYGWADIVVIPSRFEGFPNVLLEAMACGKAAIVSNCLTGPYEITSQGKFGQLVPVENAEALAAEILHLGEHKILRETLGQQASIHIASKYDTNVIGPQIKALFKNLVS
jgi:glycosyltransferase involved in cell wall biosynthesis